MKLHVRIENGTLAGRTYELEAGFLTAGRSETCSIRFDPVRERIASKQHAFIEARADGFYIRDNRSTNGTYVNGARVETAKLNHGDRIQFGRDGVTASVAIEGGSASQPDIRRLEVQVFRQAAAAPPPPDLQQSFANLALGRMPAVKAEPSKTGRYIGIGVTIFAIVFLTIFVALIMFASVGVVPAFIATFVAFLPAMLYLLPFIWLDRYDPEPLWLLALAFAWGALVSVIFSFFANTIFGVGVALATSPELGDQMGAVIAAPIFEEGSKGLGLVILLIFFRRYFDDILDGIVFAGVIALGFATVENVLYYGRAISGGLGLLLFLFILRGIFSPFAHATFTSVMGIGCGIARESHKTSVRVIMPVLGYIGAVALHALWNGLATYGMTVVEKMGLLSVCENYGMTGRLEEITCAFPITYTIFQVPLFAIFMIFTLLMMRRQKRIVREMIAIDIARGLISQEQADTATSAFRSTFWKLAGLFEGKYRARSRYVQAIGKLGLSYWHIQRATAAQGQTGSFQQNPILREEILRWRDQV